MGPALIRFLSVLSSVLEMRGADATTLKYIDTAKLALRVHQGRREALEDLTDQMQTFLDEGRDPTEEEIVQLGSTRATLFERIEAAKEELRRPAVPQDDEPDQTDGTGEPEPADPTPQDPGAELGNVNAPIAPSPGGPDLIETGPGSPAPVTTSPAQDDPSTPGGNPQ